MTIPRQYRLIESAPALVARGILVLSGFLHPCFHNGFCHGEHPSLIGTRAGEGAASHWQTERNGTSVENDTPCPVCAGFHHVSAAAPTWLAAAEYSPAPAATDSGRVLPSYRGSLLLRGPPA